MSAMLYLVPTPIGNLSDISERCREALYGAVESLIPDSDGGAGCAP